MKNIKLRVSLLIGIVFAASICNFSGGYLGNRNAVYAADITTNHITTANQAVSFKDENLEKVIRDAIHKSEGTIYESDLAKITKLNAIGKGIKDLSGIEYLINLQNLNLGAADHTNYISDITPLAGLVNLNSLDLSYNFEIADISALKGLNNLQYLDLSSNKITNITPLKGLIKLQSLLLSSNSLKDISVLKSLTKLQKLYLDNNQITDINALKGLKNLQTLYLWNNHISDSDKKALKNALPNCLIYFENPHKAK